MSAPIIVAVISAAASIIIAALSFSFTKAKEREAEWRKQKLEHYREFLEALSGIVGSDATSTSKLRWARACNIVGLVASQPVLTALHQFQDATAASNKKSTIADHDRCLSDLMLAIRADLDVSPKDDPATFSFRLWCSGVHDKAT